MERRGGSARVVTRGASLTVFLTGLIASGASASADELRFTFDVPAGYVDRSGGGQHLLVSPDAAVALEINSFRLRTAAEVEALFREVESGRGMRFTRAPRKRDATTWIASFTRIDEAVPSAGVILARLFPGEGVVVLRAVSHPSLGRGLEELSVRLAKSLRVGKGAPGGEAVRAKQKAKLREASLGPWRISWPTQWTHKPGADGVVALMRAEPELFVIAQYEADFDAEEAALLARRPFPLGEESLSPSRAPTVEPGRVIGEWRGATMGISAYVRCADDGCLFLYVGSAHEHELLRGNATLWFLAHSEREASAAAAVDEPPAAKRPAQGPQQARAPDPKNRLVRKVANKRLRYSITTGYGSDGVFVGGKSAREMHFCSDGRVYAAEDGELVATGYESARAQARQGRWTTMAAMGRNALAITWSGGEEDVLIDANPLAAVEAALEQATPAERRKIEKALAEMEALNQVMLLRLGERVPWVFQRQPSALCAK